MISESILMDPSEESSSISSSFIRSFIEELSMSIVPWFLTSTEIVTESPSTGSSGVIDISVMIASGWLMSTISYPSIYPYP